MNTRIFAAPALVLFAVLFTQAVSAESITTETADAEDAGSTPSAMFKTLDADNNGYISAEEANANPAVAEAFGDGDVNGDGQLSMEEFAKMDLGAE